MTHNEDAEPQDHIGDFALRGEARNLRREIDALARLGGIVAIGSGDAINDGTGKAGKFLHIKSAFVDPGNVHAAFEIELGLTQTCL